MICSNNINCPQSTRDLPSPTIIVRLQNNMQDLNNALNLYVIPKEIECPSNQCTGTVIGTRTLQSHLFIETDVIAENQQIPLHEFPLEFFIENSR